MTNEEMIDIIKTIKDKQPKFGLKIVPEAVIQNYKYCFYAKITDLKEVQKLLNGYSYQDLTTNRDSKYLIIHEPSNN